MRPALRLGLCAVVLSGAACGGGRGDGDGDGPVDGGPVDGGPGDGDDAAYLFDESVVRTYELTLAPEDWTFLRDDPAAEEYVPAGLRLGDDEFAGAALRFKGSYGSLFFCASGGTGLEQPCDKLPLKIAFDQYDEEGRFHGVKKLNLHAMDADPTKMHEAIAYKLFRDAGVPAPRTAYARVIVNGELQGLFVVVEQIDGRFTRDVFPDGGEGNLYKEVWPDQLTAQPYLDALETNRDEAPSADKMLRFARALADADDEGFADVIDAWMEPGQLARYMAVARLIDSWDDVVAWYCPGGCYNHNYFWYESATEDRVWLIAWDTDHSLEEPSPIRTEFGMPDWDDLEADCGTRTVFFGIPARAPSCDPIIRRIATYLWDDYAAASQALLDGDFAEAALGARIDALEALIADAVDEDPNAIDAPEWQQAVSDLRTVVIPAKRQHISDKL